MIKYFYIHKYEIIILNMGYFNFLLISLLTFHEMSLLILNFKLFNLNNNVHLGYCTHFCNIQILLYSRSGTIGLWKMAFSFVYCINFLSSIFILPIRIGVLNIQRLLICIILLWILCPWIFSKKYMNSCSSVLKIRVICPLTFILF